MTAGQESDDSGRLPGGTLRTAVTPRRATPFVGSVAVARGVGSTRQSASRLSLYCIRPLCPLTKPPVCLRAEPRGNQFLVAFRRDLAAARIPEQDARGRKVVLHSLRHSLATMLAISGVPIAIAQRILRHRDIRLTAEVYCDEALLPVAYAMTALPSLAVTGAETAPFVSINGDQNVTTSRHGRARGGQNRRSVGPGRIAVNSRGGATWHARARRPAEPRKQGI